jgi:hypothetical protein
MVADHEGPGVDQMEPGPDSSDGQFQPSRAGNLGLGEDLAEPLDLGRVVAGDEDFVPARRGVELGLDLVQFAREPFD